MNIADNNTRTTLSVSITTETGEKIQSTKTLSEKAIALSDNLPYLILEQEAEKIAEAYQTLRQHAP